MRTTIYLDEEKQKRFKTECARRGIAMSNVVSWLVEDWLRKFENSDEELPNENK